MIRIRPFPGLMLLVIYLAACGPMSGSHSPNQATNMPSPTLRSIPDSDVPAELLSTDIPATCPLPIATSQGPGLHATDPKTVSLASGDGSLWNFFRFP